MNHLTTLLSTAEVFGKLTDLERETLSRLAAKRHIKKGEIIFFQEDLWPNVCYIATGELRSVINSPDGRSYIISPWAAGEVFWGHTIFDELPMPSTLEASRASILYQWKGEDALKLVLGNQAATRDLLRRQVSLIRRRRENIYSLVFNPVVSRLAKLIVDKFESAENPTVQRDLTLEEMAGMIATSPVVVCRLLYRFQAEGILSINRASITLNDRKALECLVEQEDQ
ncbi:MAG: Crp/Fnr family transcriptional regulator [Anaerolineales bacterium]|jgi:CRP/FNR family transcriptional regulator|nr:Crp/Fnr family transcriptional regulator [Anaerolineales bacterium]